MSGPIAWLAFFVASGLGAQARFLIDGVIGERTAGVFPWSTLAINVAGSFVLGVLAGLVLYHDFDSTSRIVLGTGFCGAFTTFSTFTFEAVSLYENDHHRAALRDIAAMIVAGGAAAALGIAVTAL